MGPATDSEASSLTGSWTLLEKEEEVVANKPESESSSDGGSSIEVLDKKDGQKTEDLDGATHESLTSTISTVSVASDGIPIKSEDGGDDDGNVGDQYVWNNEGERELPEERVQEIQQPDIDDEEEEEKEDERRLDPGEPGYDLDDDGLPGEPLPPLPQEVELYPSQELDPNFQIIKTEKIYKHDKNLQVDHFLTAILVLALALVIGLGIGHFLGLSERLEVQEMYENLQEERLDTLQEDLVTCIEGEEGLGGDDQDLDDRVIKQLWEENQDLRDQVHQMKSDYPQADEAMTAILRDRINDLLTANADLEREVVRLRYADAARGAAESVETLKRLRNTRDTLNDIVTENDQLKIEEEFTSPWPSKRNEELKTAKDDETINDTENKEENSMTTIHQYLTKLLKVGGEALSKDGKTKWVQSEKLMMGLKDDLLKTFNDKFGINEDVTAILGKFNDLKTFITPNSVPKNLKTFQVASEKFLKSLLGAVDDLREANEDAAETSNWRDSFNYEAAKIKKALEQKWTKIYNKMQELNMNKDRDDDDDDDDDKKQRPNDDMKKSKQNKKKWNGRDDDDDDDEGYKSHDEGNADKSFKFHKNRGNHKYKERHDDDDDDDDDDKSYKSYKNRGNHKYNERCDDDDDDDDNDIKRENRQDKEFRRRENSEDFKSSENKRKHKSKERNTTNWEQKRSNGREKRRTENDRSDWIFERAKQRKDLRYEETRADWYFERKKLRDGNKCLSDECNSKPKGEKFVKEPHNYVKNHINERKFSKDQEKFKEEKKQKYDEKTKYAEKHFSDNKKKNFKKKPKIY